MKRNRMSDVFKSIRAILVAMTVLPVVLTIAASAQESTADAPWFDVPELNTGLGDLPKGLERETPRDAMDNFLRLTSEGDDEAAAHILNLNSIPAAEQPKQGARLARMLAEVMQRRVIIDWTDLPGRRDGLNASLPENHPFAGKPRRSIEISELETNRRPVTIRLNRLKPANGDPVWVFSAQTVKDVPRLYAQYGPGWIESKVPKPLTHEVITNVRLWELFVFPLLVALASGVFLLLQKCIGYGSRKIPIKWLNRASEKVRTPLAVGVTALLVKSTLDGVFSFSSLITTILSPVLLATIIFSTTLAILKTIDATLEVVTDRYVGDLDSKYDSKRRHLYTNIYALRRYVLLAAVVISVVLILLNLNMFDSIGMSLLASAGVATVVLGIAGQTVLGNILASLQIAIAKPIRIGDAVQYEGRWAYVEAIYYTFITLRSWDSRRLIVPVRYFISHPFENWTMTEAKSTRVFTMELDHSADPAKLREVFEDICAEDPDVMSDEMLFVAVEGYTDTAQQVSFYATADNPSDAWTMNVRLAESMGDWVRKNRPDWWPRVKLRTPELAKDLSGALTVGKGGQTDE